MTTPRIAIFKKDQLVPEWLERVELNSAPGAHQERLRFTRRALVLRCKGFLLVYCKDRPVFRADDLSDASIHGGGKGVIHYNDFGSILKVLVGLQKLPPKPFAVQYCDDDGVWTTAS